MNIRVSPTTKIDNPYEIIDNPIRKYDRAKIIPARDSDKDKLLIIGVNDKELNKLGRL